MVERIRPHDTIRFIPEMTRVSDMKVSFKVDKEAHYTLAPTHFEPSGGYCVKAMIQPDFEITMAASAGCFSLTRLNPFAKRVKAAYSDRLRSANCRDLGGRIVGVDEEKKLRCKENEASRGKVWDMKCACICCVPAEFSKGT